MGEISRVDYIEFPRNAAGDTLAERQLSFLGNCTATGSTLTLDRAVPLDLIGKVVEVKHPTDLTKYELRTVSSVSGNDMTLNVALSNVYPSGSVVFSVMEKDFLDSEITDRTEVHVLFIEKEYRSVD